MESWYRDNCPNCQSINWWCNGDENDLTQMDVEGVKCWKCKKVWALEDRKTIKEDDIYYETAKKAPGNITFSNMRGK